jgi:flagellar biosynthesis protein FlhG
MPEIYPVGGGKGGVGKSFIAASLGAFLAKQGHKVALVDLDLGASNLHTYLGIKNPACGLDRYLNKKDQSLEHAAAPTGLQNLSVITSLHCSFDVANLHYVQKQKIIKAISKLPFDYVLLDLGPGTSYNTLDFFLTSNDGILVLTPELPSIENAFHFIKAIYLRKLKQIVKQPTFDEAVKSAAAESNNAPANSNDLIKAVLEYEPDKENFRKEKLNELKIKLVLNFCRKDFDPKLGEKIRDTFNRHFYSDFEFLGNIRFNDSTYDSLLSKYFFVLRHPDAPASVDLKTIANRLTRNQK